MVMSKPLIKLENVSMVFEIHTMFGEKKKIKAVEDVSLEIKENDILALVGESGCGKSTLGRIMLGLLKPTSGKVLYYINGKYRDIWSLSKKEYKIFRRNAQLIPQNPYTTINPMRSVISALIPPFLHYKIARNKEEARKMVAEHLKMVGLVPPEDFFNRYSCRLSGGQLQRIAIARAISVKPKFIVADEAVSMLDASLRIEILDLLLRIREKYGLAVLFITHDLAIARYFARKNKIAIMYLGNIVEMGNTEDIIKNPLHPYTKALIMSVPIPDPDIARKRELPKLRSLEVPSLMNPPSGCKFHTRCSLATEICEKQAPILRNINGRLVACHKIGD